MKLKDKLTEKPNWNKYSKFASMVANLYGSNTDLYNLAMTRKKGLFVMLTLFQLVVMSCNPFNTESIFKYRKKARACLSRLTVLTSSPVMIPMRMG